MPVQPTHFSRPSDPEQAVSWPVVTLGLSALGIGCLLLGTYVVGPLVRERTQPAPVPAAPAAYAPAPTPLPPVAAIPPGQNAVHVTEHPEEPQAPAKPATPPDSITPVIEPAAPASAPPDIDPAEATPATPPEPAKNPSAPAPASPPATETPASPAISLAPPPPASVGEPVAGQPAPAARYFHVQVGRFNNRGDAETLKGELGKAGYTPTIVKVTRDGREEFRVQVNTFRLRENATRTMEELKLKQYAPYLAEDNP